MCVRLFTANRDPSNWFSVAVEIIPESRLLKTCHYGAVAVLLADRVGIQSPSQLVLLSLDGVGRSVVPRTPPAPPNSLETHFCVSQGDLPLHFLNLEKQSSVAPHGLRGQPGGNHSMSREIKTTASTPPQLLSSHPGGAWGEVVSDKTKNRWHVAGSAFATNRKVLTDVCALRRWRPPPNGAASACSFVQHPISGAEPPPEK